MSWSPSIPERIERLASVALAHIKVLAGNIGPRPTGSSAERQTLDYLSGLLSEWGYEVQREGVAFAPLPCINLPYLFGAGILGIAGWIGRDFPWLALATPFLFMLLPQASRWWIQKRKPTHSSENLLAWLGQSKLESPPALMFCAHVDTARTVPLRNPWLLRLYSRTFDILQRFAWMIFALALLQTWGGLVADGLHYAVASLGSLGGVWLTMLQLMPSPEKEEFAFSPGANDNASGVGVLLTLAEEIAKQQPGHGSIAFLFTTAEESGLYGARDFTKAHPEWAETTAVVCVDMVGSGEALYYVAKEGIFNPLYTSTELGKALRQANPSLKPLWHTLRSGDYASFCQSGFRAIGLEAGGRSLTDWSYHSAFDTVEKIDPQMLKQVLETLLVFLEKDAEARLRQGEKQSLNIG